MGNMYNGHNVHSIYRTTFMFFYGIGKKRLQNVKNTGQQNGLEVRVHKKQEFLPDSYLSIEMIKKFKGFLLNYLEENAIFLPESA